MMSKKEQPSTQEMLEILAEMISENNEYTKKLEINQAKFLDNLRQSISHQVSYQATLDLNRRINYLGDCMHSHTKNMNSIRVEYRETFASFRTTLKWHRKSYLISYVGIAFSFFTIGFCAYDEIQLRNTLEEKEEFIQLQSAYFNKFLNDEKQGERFLKWKNRPK